jgi:OmpA-OmpF porin, OOP family
MRRAILGPMAVSALLSALALDGRAAADGLDGLYLGANAGYTLSTYSHAALDDALVSTFDSAGDDLTLHASFAHSKQVDWSADIGYMFAPEFGIEASYLDLGTLNYFARGTVKTESGSVPTSVHLDISSRGPTLALVAVLPMTNEWSVNARLGAYESRTASDATTAIDGSVSPSSESETSTALLAGAGTTYALGAHWVLRLHYEYLDQVKEKLLGKSFNVNLLTAGVAYAF